MIVNKNSNQSQVLKTRCLYYERRPTEEVQGNKTFSRVMSDVTTPMKTFRAERRLGIRYRVLGQRTGSYMACNHRRQFSMVSFVVTLFPLFF